MLTGQIALVWGQNNPPPTTSSQLMEIISQADDAEIEGNRLLNLGTRESLQAAIVQFEKAQKLFGKLNDKFRQAAMLTSSGRAFDRLGEKQQALTRYEQALSLIKIFDDKRSESILLNNIGLVYSALGEKRKALEFHTEALALSQKIGNKIDEARTLLNIGDAHLDLGDAQQALKFFEQALTLSRQAGDKHGESAILNNIGRVYDELNQKQKALEFYAQSIPLSQIVGDKQGEAATLNNIGAIYDNLKERQKAVEHYTKALPIFRLTSNKESEAVTLNNLMVSWKALGNRRLSAFYGKQAVNILQNLRRNIQTLDKNLQKTYLKSIESTYRDLADVLIADGRITEAQQVLALLKEEEFFDFVRRDKAEIEKLKARADLRKDESEALRRYEEFADRIAEIGAEFGSLQDKKNKLAEGKQLSADEQKLFDELSQKLDDANKSFQVFMRQLADEFARKSNVVAEAEENRGLQSDLKNWGAGVVALYTIVGEDRYRVILTTPEAQIDGKTEIKSADLNRKVYAFRQALQNPHLDPRPLGRELYDILIKPIEKHLVGAKAKTLLLSLDGTLRYLPIAALWDGEKYLAEKYETVVITLASRTRLSEPTNADWRVLGLGVTESKEVAADGETMTFSALPAVRQELAAIVRDEQTEAETGVLPGRRLLDAEFTEAALKERLGKGYRLVHIASPFAFRPGDMTKSFLLLGDGNTLSLDHLRSSPQLRFTNVELLTLSACNTAVGESDANGREVESFAVLAQQNGAKAVLASLWSVADESTQILMAEFYRLRKENPQMTKSEVLRQAQLSMLAGKLKPSNANDKQRTKTVNLSDEKNAVQFKSDTAKPFAHPFFWSPFVLIGNWR